MASDLYSALIGAPVDSAEKQAALADLLRRKAGFANVAQLTGDPSLAPMGAQQAQQVQQQAQQLQRAAMADREMQMAQQREARVAADQQEALELQRSAQGLTRRGQDLDYTSALARTMAELEKDKQKAAAAANKPPTDAQAGARAYLGRMQKAEGLLGTYAPNTTDYMAASSIYGGGNALTASLASKAMSAEGQKYYQAAADWVRAKLRKESGAAIGADEMKQEIRTYFPLPGEGPEQVAQKAAARKAAEEEIAVMGATEVSKGDEPTKPEATKTINGVTYTKVGGKWYAD